MDETQVRNLIVLFFIALIFRIIRSGYILACIIAERHLPYGCSAHLVTALLFLLIIPFELKLIRRIGRRKQD